MTEPMNQRIVLAARPEGRPKATDFRLESTEVPTPGEGEVLLENLYFSLDPYMRWRMNDRKSYVAPIAVDSVMEGASVSRIRQSRHAEWQEGDIVLSHAGWQRFALSDGRGLRRLDPDLAPPSTAMGVLGMTGFTAYVGLLEIGRPKPGETVVVAAASGAVGSVVGQIARIYGARSVGIAGGAEKCAYVRDELGFDAVVDHRAPGFAEKLAEACPDGVDVYFENVGGRVWDAVFPLLNDFARVPVCGLISQYNDGNDSEQDIDRLPGTMQGILTKRLTVRGFIQTEFVKDFHQTFLEDASSWVADGRLKYREDVVEGIERAPEAFMGLLEGKNFGKLIVRP